MDVQENVGSKEKIKKYKRASSVSSQKKILHNFSKENSKSNLIQANKHTRNAGHSNTVGGRGNNNYQGL